MSGVSEKAHTTEREDGPGEAPAAAPPSEEERKLTESPPREPVQPPRAVVPRWVQLVLLPITLLALWAVAKAAGKVLVIFIVAALIALILNPAVALLHRARLPRGLAVLAVYLAFFLMLSGIGVLLANPISNQVESFSRNVPNLVTKANHSLASLQRTLNNSGVHVQFIKQGKTALQTAQEQLIKASSSIVSSAGGVLTEVVSAGFDFVLVFVLSIYMLLYGPRIGHLMRRYMPDGDGTPADDYPTLVQNAVARYVGGQLLFSLIMGATAGIALYLLGVAGIFPDGRKYAVALGVFYGLMELVPYIGPIVGAVPAVLLALLSGHPISALWVTVTFIALQQLEGHIVAPQIFGHTLRINPLLVIFALLLGLQLHGVIGALIALPILSVLRETAVYLSRHITFEPWGRTDRRLL
ncbi:MAG TPA: AI-2E family transporter [Solirubrobacteraceae bacterium]|nr:AI-2E family transporter [Solirubrobacteraceae bacterium]